MSLRRTGRTVRSHVSPGYQCDGDMEDSEMWLESRL